MAIQNTENLIHFFNIFYLENFNGKTAWCLLCNRIHSAHVPDSGIIRIIQNSPTPYGLMK